MTQQLETLEIKQTAQDLLMELNTLLQNGVLPREKFGEYQQIVAELHSLKGKEEIGEEMLKLRKQFPALGSDRTMQGLAYVKKHGYAGDYEIIDKIYTEWQSDHPELKTWDIFFHEQAAPQAVRNRKTFFKEVLRSMSGDKNKTEFRILNLASGPCRDLFEFFEEMKDLRFKFTCVELDANAIAYAKNLLGPYQVQVEFIQQNIFRYVPTEKYDLVWSAGLFDYFDDNTFTKILARFIHQPYVVIGNFSDSNPTSGYMEVIGEWFLNYRSAGTLRRLAKDAGFHKDVIRVAHEPSEVNLFLTINRTSDDSK